MRLLLAIFLCSIFAGCCSEGSQAGSSQLGNERASTTDYAAETERAFKQERDANVVVFYDLGDELSVERPDREQHFDSETALLRYLAERKVPKQLLVVILSKRHEWSDPAQTLDGFWLACKNCGFAKVVIQRGTAFGRPILRE